jgi:hypothetical protein
VKRYQSLELAELVADRKEKKRSKAEQGIKVAGDGEGTPVYSGARSAETWKS